MNFYIKNEGSIGVGIFFDLVFIAKKRVSLPWGRRILLGRLSSKMKVSPLDQPASQTSLCILVMDVWFFGWNIQPNIYIIYVKKKPTHSSRIAEGLKLE